MSWKFRGPGVEHEPQRPSAGGVLRAIALLAAAGAVVLILAGQTLG